VEVVEHEHQRGLVGQAPEQALHRAMSAVALVGQLGRGVRLGGPRRGQDRAELDQEAGFGGLPQIRHLRRHVCVEGVDPDAERNVALELRSRAGEHEMPAGLGALPQLVEEPRLADPRLALDGDARRATARECI
jgi:hypothetical protein